MLNYIIVSILIMTNLNMFASGECGPGEERAGGSSRGRCVKSKKAIQAQNEAKECMNAEDPQACIDKKIAEQRENNSRQDDYDTSGLGRGAQIAVHVGILAASIYAAKFWDHIFRTKKIVCDKSTGGIPPSMYGISAGALTLLGAEVASYISYSSALKETNQQLAALQAPKEDDPNTSKEEYFNSLTERAYDAIITKEKAYRNATKIRRDGYAIATGLFTASTIQAAFELTGVYNGRTYRCRGGTDKEIKEAGRNREAKQGNPNSVRAIMGRRLAEEVPDLILNSYIKSTPKLLDKANFYEYKGLSYNNKRLISSLDSAESHHDLNMIQLERQRLETGKISSPEISLYRANDFLAYDIKNFQIVKKSMITAEIFRAHLETYNWNPKELALNN